MGKVHWIPWESGTLIEEKDQAPSLEELQKYVGGWIEVVDVLFNGKRCQMVINEEGVLRDLPKNPRATEIYWAASKAAGYDLGKIEDRERLQDDQIKEFREQFGPDVQFMTLDPRGPLAAPVIQGNAVVLEDLRLE